MIPAAKTLSWLLHPIFMPLLTLFVAIQVDPKLSYFMSEEATWVNYALIGIMTIAFPLVSISVLYRNGLISSFYLHDRAERFLPFSLTLFYYILSYYLIRQVQMDTAIYSMLLGAMVDLLFTTLISSSWKISVHMVGIGGLFGALVALTNYHYPTDATYLLGTVLLISGALASARLLLGAHDSGQVYAGFILGTCCVFGTVALGIWF